MSKEDPFFKKDEEILIDEANFKLIELLKADKDEFVLEVWVAIFDGRKVVLKFTELDDSVLVSSFDREVLAYGRVKGNYFAQFLCSEELEVRGKDFACLALEYIEGQTLFELILSEDQTGQIGQVLPFRRALELAREIVLGQIKIEEAGLVQLDLKPENIIVFDNRVIILDLESCCEFYSVLASPRRLVTPLYVSPELICSFLKGQPKATEHHALAGESKVRSFTVKKTASIFSFGIILFELLVQREPFRGVDHSETFSNILHRDPPIDELKRRDIPEALISIIRKCFEKDPNNRYQSYTEVLTALDSLQI